MYEIFRRLCEDRGITTYRFCKDTGINASTISTWKNRNTTCNLKLATTIAEYFGVSVDYVMTGNEGEDGKKYYLNDETAQVAQEIFENKELRALFDVQKDMDPEDLRALHNMALALKRKERGDIDDTGC